MAATGFCLFDTPLGRCAVAWSDRGIRGVALPDADAALRARLSRRHPEAVEAEPPASVQAAIARIRALLDGGRDDLADIALDLDDAPEFNRRAWEASRAVPPGQTVSYGELAARLGDPTLARSVGQAMAENPCPIIVPCHRVLAADGSLGGFSAPGGAVTKRRMLRIEGAPAVAQGSLFED